MAERKPEENEASLPFAALQLLAPPLRLVSAAFWKVMKQRDVMQYGVVEDFVTSVCEAVPGLLTLRHQGKLALGLRGRLILELCSNQADENVIKTHLEKMRAPAVQSPSGAASVRDLKVHRTVESFHLWVQTLLADPAEREQFFQEEFPVDYGPDFDQELEKLLWEFLIRLDQFLPAPNLATTVSWLSETPPVLEECARAASQPQLLKMLLQHETCLGHLDAAASLPPNMGDSILASLSLPPSGRLPTGGAQRKDRTLITPVFGTISNEDVAVLSAASKKRESLKSAVAPPKQSEEDVVNAGRAELQEGSASKRKQPGRCDSDENDEASGVVRSRRTRMSKRLRKGASATSQAARERRVVSDEGGAGTPERGRAIFETQQDPSPVSSLDKQHKDVGKKCEGSAKRRNGAAKSSHVEEQNQRNRSQKPDSDNPGQDDKENYPTIPSASGVPSQQHSSAEALTHPEVEDYVADSEDEATKNFKYRLFTKSYFKTKHGTFVPTLREHWRPGRTQRRLLSDNYKHR